jgi:hypothetical protein
LALAADARALVVRHESEHLNRRDPRLLLHAFFVVVAMPWNLGVWWQFRRLRRAIELDCDARVIGSGVDVARYGEVLIEAGGFCRSAGLPALATFAERSGDLEARIRALAPVRAGRRGIRIAVGALATLVLAVAACLVPDPLSPELTQKLVEAAAPGANPPGNLEWVRGNLSGMGPAEVVILIRSSTGQLLAKEQMRKRTSGVGRPERVGGGAGILEGVPSGSIESIEVIKSSALLELPGIGGVIVVTLKPGERLPIKVTGAAPDLRQLATLPSGPLVMHFGSGRSLTIAGRRYTRQ